MKLSAAFSRARSDLAGSVRGRADVGPRGTLGSLSLRGGGQALARIARHPAAASPRVRLFWPFGPATSMFGRWMW